MKKTFYSLLTAVIVSFSSLCAQGAEATAQATVRKLQGTVTATIDGKTSTLVVGDRLPQGAKITTGKESLVDIETIKGAIATIGVNSTVVLEKISVTTSGGAVTKQTSLLDLKVGGILSNIDPANKKINDYGIRTPKGVAAARGTAYAVQVAPNGIVTILVTSSSIQLIPTLANGQPGTPVTVRSGQIVTVNPATGAITVNDNPSQAQRDEVIGGTTQDDGSTRLTYNDEVATGGTGTPASTNVPGTGTNTVNPILISPVK